jgi:catechol 2,3-dioxygenase
MCLGAVRLNVADLDRARRFYEEAIGLRGFDRGAEVVRLGVDGETAIVELVGRPDAPLRPPGTTGLFHLAILLPSRADLARALRRVADAGWRLTGASDHLVSEALYLQDPEGNGIEIYRDRPREQWRYEDGQLQMDTLPLDSTASSAS